MINKQVLPGIELGTFCTPDSCVTTTPRETRREILDIASSGNEFSYNIFLRAFSLELPLKRPV